MLVSHGEHGDFEISLQVRGSNRSPGNSDVQLRSRYDAEGGWPPCGRESYGRGEVPILRAKIRA